MKLYELVNHYHIGTELTCAEAVFMACNEYYHLNLSEETRKMFSVMGLGMQTEQSCCGAFTVAVGIIGLTTAKEGQTDADNMEGYQMIAELTDFMLGFYGTLHCVELQKLEIVGYENPCHAIVEALRAGLRKAHLPETAVSLIEDTSHASANELMTADGLVDLLIPRGGAGLIRACVENATVPCIQTGTGICHVYVDAAADLEMAVNIVENAKTSRPSVCNAEEALLVHRDVAAQFLPMLKQRLVDDRTAAGLTPVELHLDARAAAIIDGVPAAPADFDTEYLDYKLSVAVVDTLDDAIAHIAKHSTHHSEAIITADKAAAQRFTACVDSAAVYVNASTRFTDGGEFGLGCEMGISTQKLHARGPMGLAELCTYKYIIHGSGQTRGGAAAKLQTPCC